MIFLILIGAYVFGSFLTITRLPTILADFVNGLAVSRYVILAVIIVIYAVMLGICVTRSVQLCKELIQMIKEEKK
jgi:TRAP-type C4-dicarboxylate transport system permease large subunit